jgi:multisubunit Na+/H+ antiporter MnhG subunit
MLMIIGGIFVLLGIVGMIINTPAAIREVLSNGIPASYSIILTIILVLFWLFSFYGFGFNLKITIAYLVVLSIFWLLSFKYHRNK